LQFVIVSNSNSGLFAAQPICDPSGKLTFTPQEGVEGSAQIAVAVMDDGGTDHGGIDTSDPQIFTIQVDWAEPWHNRTLPADVSADGNVVAEDVIDVINYINAKGSGPLDVAHAAVATVIGGNMGYYYDVTGDNYVAADDVVAIINYINAHHTNHPTPPEGEAGSSSGNGTGDLLLILAADVAEQGWRRK